MKKLLEFAGFQLVWFACVLGAAHEAEWLGCVAALAFAGACALRSGNAARSMIAILLAGVVGSGVDALQRGLGWIDYRGAPVFAVWAPAWILALWIAFAATFSSSMAWLRGRPWVSVPFAAVGAPLSYLGAERLGAVAIETPRLLSLCGIGAAWVAGFHTAQRVEARSNHVPAR